MNSVDYDLVAHGYDARYGQNRYDGIGDYLRRFLAQRRGVIAEVGCGTGHWLAALLREEVGTLVGLDVSAGMLNRARQAAPAALLVRGTAMRLPWASGAFDAVYCVHALHHFEDKAAFLAECRRVLRPGGAFLTIGLDPHQGDDRWWVYDFFPAALIADRSRYQAASQTRAMLAALGFSHASTELAQHLPAEVSYESAQRRGILERQSTSQLMVISDHDYEAGVQRMRSERPVLRADLHLYATAAVNGVPNG